MLKCKSLTHLKVWTIKKRSAQFFYLLYSQQVRIINILTSCLMQSFFFVLILFNLFLREESKKLINCLNIYSNSEEKPESLQTLKCFVWSLYFISLVYLGGEVWVVHAISTIPPFSLVYDLVNNKNFLCLLKIICSSPKWNE